MEKTGVLLKDDNDNVVFYYNVDALESHYATVSVFEVVSRDMNNNVLQGDLYLGATIKWDGCSHVSFSEEGYKHLCGKRDWENHSKMMLALYDVVTPMITGYDKECAEG